MWSAGGLCVINSLDQLLVGRALAGVAVGAFSMAAPCYLAEVIATINCGLNADLYCAIQVENCQMWSHYQNC